MPRRIEAGFVRVIILLVVVILLGAIVFFLKPWNKLNLPVIPKTSSNNLGATIYQQTQNPVNKLPETNPFSKVNPFKGVYKNPFQ